MNAKPTAHYADNKKLGLERKKAVLNYGFFDRIILYTFTVIITN